MKKVVLYIFLLVFYLFFLTQNVYAANLLIDPDFEEINDTTWKKNTSSIVYTNTEEDHYQGIRSAKITNTKTSSFGIEQTILDISSSLTYNISAFAKPIFPTDKVFLRVAWYKSSDGSGSQLSTDDSDFSHDTNWQKLEILKTPPDGIQSAKLRLLVASGSAYFDSASFEESFSPTTTPSTTPSPTQIPQISPTLTITSSPTPSPTPISFNNIFISEVMIDPPIDENEWIELYNSNDFDVELTNWYIDDLENAGSNPKSFSLNIKARSYASVDLTSSIFNNDADSIRLLDYGKNQKNILIYSKSEKGKSLAKPDPMNNSFCIQEPTKNQPNNLCVVSTITSTTAPSTPHPVNQSKNLNPSTAPTNIVAPIISLNNYSSKSEVLGEKTGSKKISNGVGSSKNVNLVKFLSSLSFSYSLLTIFSIFLKMKINV